MSTQIIDIKESLRYIAIGFFVLLSMNMAGQTVGKEYVMQRNILESYLSPDSSFLCLIFGEKNAKGKNDKMQQVGLFNMEQQRLTFLSEDVNVKHGNGLVLLKDGVLIGTDNGDVYLVDSKNGDTSMYSDKTVYYHLFDVGDNICIGRKCPDENDFIIINKNGEVILHLPMGIGSVYCVGDSLYYTLGKSLYRRYLH